MATTSHFTPATLAAENDQYYGTAGCSAGNRGLGFRPAFRDSVAVLHARGGAGRE